MIQKGARHFNRENSAGTEGTGGCVLRPHFTTLRPQQKKHVNVHTQNLSYSKAINEVIRFNDGKSDVQLVVLT